MPHIGALCDGLQRGGEIFQWLMLKVKQLRNIQINFFKGKAKTSPPYKTDHDMRTILCVCVCVLYVCVCFAKMTD